MPTRTASALLVDPTVRSRSMVGALLAREGISIEVCGSVEEAIASLDALLHDVVITALADRDANHEFAEFVHLRHPEVPIVQIVPEGPNTDDDLLDLGGSAVMLSLPTSGPDLLRAVHMALDHREQRERTSGMVDEHYVRDRQNEALSDLLDQALENVYLVYQPVMRAHSSCTVGYEALLRTTTRRFAKVSALLAVAERLGRKADVDNRVRELLVAEFQNGAQWRTFFVNLDVDELSNDVLGLDSDPLLPYASRIVVEFSQHFAIPLRAPMLSTLHHMRDCGYRIAVGNIHSTTSSLVRMRVLTPDIYKLGAGVVRRCDRSPVKQKYIADVVEMAHGEGAMVVAQGIERPEELQAVVDLGCDLTQGFFLGIPRATLD